MGPTEIFLIAWVVAAVLWELVALATGLWEPISPVLSRLPTWAIAVLMYSWTTLVIHWWAFQKSEAYRFWIMGVFR